MNIYRMFSSNNDFKSIQYGQTPLMKIIGEEDWENVSDIERYSFHWSEGDKEVSDAPFLIGAIPIFRSETLDHAGIKFPKNYVKEIIINVEGIEYVIVKATQIVTDLLDEKRSVISRYSDGRIMDVERYVFKKNDNVPPIFKLKQYPLFTFVTDVLGDKLNAAAISGLILEKCKISKPWFKFA